MAKSQNNVVTHGLSGKIGNMLVFRQVGGKTIVSNAPRHTDKVSETQMQARKKFQRATIYAKAAVADPDTKELYGHAAGDGKTAYNVAVADFFHAPDIEEIDMSAYSGSAGDTIQITVSDDFMVKAVTVSITNDDGSLVEEGDATPDPSGYLWTYTASQDNENPSGDRIEIIASDMPGNITSQTQTM